MIFTDDRKLALSGWLYQNHKNEFFSAIKLQKFLFLYEAIAKSKNQNADFARLEGWKNGPAFSHVWGDYTYQKMEFSQKCKECYEEKSSLVDLDIVNTSSFIVKVFNEIELSELTHQFNIWNVKKHEIESGAQRVQLMESDFNQHDIELIDTLTCVYNIDFIRESEAFSVMDKTFIISKEDFQRLTENHKFVLNKLASDDNIVLDNPTYLEIDSEGVLLVD